MRILENRLHVTLLSDGGVVNDRHAVADFLYDLNLVGDDDDGDIQFFMDIFEQMQHRTGGQGIECRGRFIT